MPTYPTAFRRCQHIKINGVQCGSPAIRDQRRCFFHEQWCLISREITPQSDSSEPVTIKFPTFEDANSIQLSLAKVMQLLVTKRINHPTASLLIRTLRAAAANLRFTSLEPQPTHVVIDPDSVENRPLGATAWSTVKGRDYDVAFPTDEDAMNLPSDWPELDREEKRSILEMDNANNPEALEIRARMLRITAAVRADRKNTRLSEVEIEALRPSRLSQTQHSNQHSNPESPSEIPLIPASNP
jgi:hypothetical protein